MTRERYPFYLIIISAGLLIVISLLLHQTRQLETERAAQTAQAQRIEQLCLENIREAKQYFEAFRENREEESYLSGLGDFCAFEVLCTEIQGYEWSWTERLYAAHNKLTREGEDLSGFTNHELDVLVNGLSILEDDPHHAAGYMTLYVFATTNE